MQYAPVVRTQLVFLVTVGTLEVPRYVFDLHIINFFHRPGTVYVYLNVGITRVIVELRTCVGT